MYKAEKEMGGLIMAIGIDEIAVLIKFRGVHSGPVPVEEGW